jgi:hypothetical protein
VHWRDKADVLREFIFWKQYEEKGLDYFDQKAIFDNVLGGKPPEQWLEGTSFTGPDLRAQRREELIGETFELSRQVGYSHFRAENFDRPDPALVRLGPEKREALLRQWWDASRDRMYASYREQVAGLSNEELASNRDQYKMELAVRELVGFDKRHAPARETPGGQDDSQANLKDQLFGATPPDPAVVHFQGYDCEVEQRTYPNGRTALVLVDLQEREDVAVATVNLPDVPLKPGEAFIKDYSENQGMLAALEKAGVVQATGERVPTGFVEVPVVKILLPDLTHSLSDRLFGVGPPAPTPAPEPQPGHSHQHRHKL